VPPPGDVGGGGFWSPPGGGGGGHLGTVVVLCATLGAYRDSVLLCAKLKDI